MYNHLEEEERAGCFALIVLRMSCYCKCSVALLHTVPWVSLQCVIVVFPDYTHLLFFYHKTLILYFSIFIEGCIQVNSFAPNINIQLYKKTQIPCADPEGVWGGGWSGHTMKNHKNIGFLWIP